jgi:hypothetical protein
MSGIMNLLLGAVPQVVPDPYFEYTTLLLPGNGTNGAQNNTFLDSSTNNFTITRNGNTTQGTFSPFSQTGWGNYFDGTSGQFLNTVANTAFNFGTGDFTVEGWVYPTSTSGTRPIVEIRTSAANSTGFALLSQSGATTLNVYTNGGFAGASTGSIATNQWNHVALVRSGNTWTYYINGTSSGSFTNSSTQSDGGTTGPKIAGSTTAGEIWIGYISNIRIVKGTAVYTSNFTPSTTPLTAISGTSLLTCQSSRFADSSTNAFAITVNGSPSVQAFSPFNPTAAWSASTNGGSGYFDGSGDYLTTTTSSAFDLSSGDWTIQGWYYPTAYSAGNNVLIYVGTSAGDKIVIADISTGGSGLYYLLNGSPVITSSTKAPLNAWSFFALVKSGSTTTLYLNGVSLGTTTSVPTSSNKSVNLGSDAGAAVFQGYFADIRILKGTANTAVPTAPLTAITDTSLLLNYTNAGIYDATSKNDLETVGNAQISTTQSKFGGSSMYFDGTGDFANTAPTINLEFGSGDFTIEGWIYPTVTTRMALYHGSSGTDWSIGIDYQSQKFCIWASSNGTTWNLINADGGGNGIGTITIATNTWTHVAFVRSGTTWQTYINGTRDLNLTGISGSIVNRATSAKSIAKWWFSTGSGVPGVWNGYIQDFRITKGVARYTANFTAPTAAFPLL